MKLYCNIMKYYCNFAFKIMNKYIVEYSTLCYGTLYNQPKPTRIHQQTH